MQQTPCRGGIEAAQALVEQLQIHLKAEDEARLAALQEKAELQKQLEAKKEASLALAEKSVLKTRTHTHKTDLLFLGLVHAMLSPRFHDGD